MIVPTNELMQASDSLATRVRDTFWIQTRCPLCGSVLISNDIDVWCSFVGGNGKLACSFGLDYDVHVDGLPAAIEHEKARVVPDATGPLQLFGYPQLDEALRLWCEMLPQERRQMAERMAAYDAPGADEFAQMIIDAIFDKRR